MLSLRYTCPGCANLKKSTIQRQRAHGRRRPAFFFSASNLASNPRAPCCLPPWVSCYNFPLFDRRKQGDANKMLFAITRYAPLGPHTPDQKLSDAPVAPFPPPASSPCFFFLFYCCVRCHLLIQAQPSLPPPALHRRPARASLADRPRRPSPRPRGRIRGPLRRVPGPLRRRMQPLRRLGELPSLSKPRAPSSGWEAC